MPDTHIDPLLAEYLDDDALASELGASTRALRRWRRQRKAPPSIRIGRKHLTSRGAVAKWLAEQETRAATAGRGRARA